VTRSQPRNAAVNRLAGAALLLPHASTQPEKCSRVATVLRMSRASSRSDARRSIALYRLRDAECHEKGHGANRP
jgi:hypothetical protein